MSQAQYADAQRMFAKLLLDAGFYEQAFADARAYYEAFPDDFEALRLYVRAARGTDQYDLARTVLTKAWKQKPEAGVALKPP